MDKSERIKDLVELLNKANKAYYQEANEIMTNFEYDKLYDELVGLEKETGMVLSNSLYKFSIFISKNNCQAVHFPRQKTLSVSCKICQCSNFFSLIKGKHRAVVLLLWQLTDNLITYVNCRAVRQHHACFFL